MTADVQLEYGNIWIPPQTENYGFTRAADDVRAARRRALDRGDDRRDRGGGEQHRPRGDEQGEHPFAQAEAELKGREQRGQHTPEGVVGGVNGDKEG